MKTLEKVKLVSSTFLYGAVEEIKFSELLAGTLICGAMIKRRRGERPMKRAIKNTIIARAALSGISGMLTVWTCWDYISDQCKE